MLHNKMLRIFIQRFVYSPHVFTWLVIHLCVYGVMDIQHRIFFFFFLLLYLLLVWLLV